MKRILPLLGALLWAGVALAEGPSIPFQKYTLKNGLTVILSESHEVPQVAVNLWYHVGAANQVPGRSGFAHLFEHMMFSGAKHIGPRPFQVLQGIGAVGANASTAFDRTNYFEVVPASQLPAALWLESDRMGFLLDTLDAHRLAIQRKVVSNERRQRDETRPYGTSRLRMMDLLYPAPHPYYDGVIGTLHDINVASVEDVKGFFRHFYVPNNASLVLVGDFDPQQAMALVKKYFGPLPRGAEVKVPNVPQPMLDHEVKETVHDKVARLPKLVLTWNGVKPFSADEAAGDVLASVLGSFKTGRLARRLVLKKQVASAVVAFNRALRLGGYFTVQVIAKPGHTVAQIQPMVQKILERVKKKGITEQELARAKRDIIASYLRGVQTLSARADLLNRYEMFTGDPGYMPKDIARYQAVTAEQVKAFADKYLSNDHRLVLDVEPAVKTASAK